MTMTLRNGTKNYDYDSLQLVLTNKRLSKKMTKMSVQLNKMRETSICVQRELKLIEKKFVILKALCFMYTMLFIGFAFYFAYSNIDINIDLSAFDPDLSHVNYFVEKSKQFFRDIVNDENTRGYFERNESI